MNIKSEYKNFRKIILKLLVLIIIFIISVILPLVLYLNTLNLSESIEIDSYLNRVERSLVYLIVIGTLIVILKLVSYLLKPISVGKLMVSVLIGIMYIVYIIISAYAEILEMSVAWFYLRIDYSVFGLFIIPVPSLAIVRNIITFSYEYKNIRCKLVILDTIAKNGAESKSQIRKVILKRKELNPNIKRHVLKEFKEILRELKTHYPKPLITGSSKYELTTAGNNFLKCYGIKSIGFDNSLTILKVWSEKDLEKIARNRALKNK